VAAELPILDAGALAELLDSTGNDVEFVRELIATYLADTPSQLEAMTAAVDSDDAAALVRPAHTLKSSSATVGASRLSARARELEMAGRSGSLQPAVHATVEAARAEWTAAAAALSAWPDTVPAK
jgi:HPt (histidine-containing phosphotransfer) domain-containing protein